MLALGLGSREVVERKYSFKYFSYSSYSVLQIFWFCALSIPCLCENGTGREESFFQVINSVPVRKKRTGCLPVWDSSLG